MSEILENVMFGSMLGRGIFYDGSFGDIFKKQKGVDIGLHRSRDSLGYVLITKNPLIFLVMFR